MVDVGNGIDRGRALFAKFPVVITRRLNDLVESYFGSTKDYVALKRRISSFDDLYDLRFKGNEAFISEIAVPVSRKIMLETKAYIRKYFENDPLFTLYGRYETPVENAAVAQKVLNYNLAMTHYRRDCMFWQIDCAAKYGVYVNFAQYVEGYGQRGTKTIFNPASIGGYESVKQEATRKNIVNYPIHPLNYFQDTASTFSYEPCFKGFIDRWTLAQLYQLRGDDRYEQHNLDEILRRARSGIKDQHYFGADGTYYSVERNDYSRFDVHVRRLWATLPIEGNEDDPTTYYIEMIDNKVVRIEENQYEGDICPLTVGNVMPRINTWWGNAGHESKIAHQNLMNWLINTQVESTMKAMDRIIFVRRGGGVDWSAVNNRHNNGGVVPVDGMDALDKVAYQMPTMENSSRSVEWLLRELKEEIQSENPVTNLQAQYNQGGLSNKTLGAAQMIATIGEILQADTMTNFGYGQQRIAESNIVGLQQLLEDQFYVKRTPQSEPEQIDKYKIFGDFDYVVETSMKVSDFNEFTKRANLLTQALNWKAAGVAEMNNINWAALVKDVLKSGIGQNIDMENYYNENAAAQGPMMQGINPAAQTLNAPPAASIPAPAPGIGVV